MDDVVNSVQRVIYPRVMNKLRLMTGQGDSPLFVQFVQTGGLFTRRHPRRSISQAV